MATDREILKNQQIGALVTTDATAPRTAVSASHTRARDFAKVGTENATTNVAETIMFTVRRKSIPTVYYSTSTTVAGNATDYVYMTVTKQTAGTNSTVVATYNTHTSAQSSITGNVPATFVTVTSSDALISAGDTLHYTITKQGGGKTVAIGTFTVDLEEV